MTSTNANEAWSFEIVEGASVIAARFQQAGGAAATIFGGGETIAMLNDPTTGAHTYFAQVSRSTGSGTGTHVSAAANKSFIYVADLGPKI